MTESKGPFVPPTEPSKPLDVQYDETNEAHAQQIGEAEDERILEALAIHIAIEKQDIRAWTRVVQPHVTPERVMFNRGLRPVDEDGEVVLEPGDKTGRVSSAGQVWEHGDHEVNVVDLYGKTGTWLMFAQALAAEEKRPEGMSDEEWTAAQNQLLIDYFGPEILGWDGWSMVEEWKSEFLTSGLSRPVAKEPPALAYVFRDPAKSVDGTLVEIKPYYEPSP